MSERPMASWTGTEIVRMEPQRLSWEPGVSPWMQNWAMVDCGCCAGMEWGGETPRECRRCAGGGVLYVHLPSGTVAQWPGGYLSGPRLTTAELEALNERLWTAAPVPEARTHRPSCGVMTGDPCECGGPL